MALNLQTLTDSSTSAGILTSLAKSASNLDLVASLENQVSGGANAAQTTATRQPRAHVPVGAGHLYLSGVSGNYASVPNETALNILGDIELQWFGEHTDGVQETLLAKYSSGGNNFLFRVKTTNKLQFYRTTKYAESTAATSSDAIGFKVTHRVSDHRVQFFETTDGTSWSQVGTDKTIPANTPTVGPAIVEIGSYGVGTSQPLSGLVNRVIIKDGIDGSSALDIEFSDGDHKASSFACSTGQTVTINTSGNDPATIVRRNFLRFDGADNSLVGVFNSTNTTGGYMFASFSVNGDGGTSSGRIFNMKSSDYASGYNSNKSFLWSLRESTTNNLAYYYNHSFRGIHTGKFDESNGVILHEVKAIDGTQFSKVNNADIKSTTLALTTLSSEDFYIAQNPSGTGTPAIDLEALYLFDHTLTDDDASKIRGYLNAKSSIY